MILAVGTPFLGGEWELCVAIEMLGILTVGAALTSFYEHLPGQEIVTKFLQAIEWVKPTLRENLATRALLAAGRYKSRPVRLLYGVGLARTALAWR
ncbi:hypothetical protein PSACC_01070 [Paramicrosporidium saccamoebae]|uniref:Uncharacterized protein n=1 Tax=Paramicrosporidium saccamoebae TaxID=1246581 RepID=A0A2H9TMV7_9FUNG|nr:hypothetical protein PSACC_01070 [Paramicrosporidium saccamoebae]